MGYAIGITTILWSCYALLGAYVVYENQVRSKPVTKKLAEKYSDL